MQIDTTKALGTPTGEVSRQNSVAPSRANASSPEPDLAAFGNGDTVQTAAMDLVQLVLRAQDKAAESRVAGLRQAYESGDYTTNTHEVAHAILAGVLCGY